MPFPGEKNNQKWSIVSATTLMEQRCGGVPGQIRMCALEAVLFASPVARKKKKMDPPGAISFWLRIANRGSDFINC